MQSRAIRFSVKPGNPHDEAQPREPNNHCVFVPKRGGAETPHPIYKKALETSALS